MPTPSPKMGLSLPSQPDDFETSDLRGNWEKIDGSPGAYICTSTSRPSWTSAQSGRIIYETDSQLEWRWTGSQFIRLRGTGLLKTATGTPAYAEAVPPKTVLGQTLPPGNPLLKHYFYRSENKFPIVNGWETAVRLPGVVIPPGNRPIRFTFTRNHFSPNGIYSFLISLRDALAPNTGTSLWEGDHTVYSDNFTFNWPHDPSMMQVLVPGGFPAGTKDFSIQVKPSANYWGYVRDPKLWVEEL